MFRVPEISLSKRGQVQNFSCEKGFHWLGKNRLTGNFHIKGFGLNLVLKQRVAWATLEWLIQLLL